MKLQLSPQEMARLLNDAWVNADGLVDSYSHMSKDPQYVENVKWRDRIEAIQIRLFGRKLQ